MKKSDKTIAGKHHQTFEAIRQLDAEDNEYLSARVLQTRRQELRDDESFAGLSEDDKRLAIRNELAANLFRATQTEEKLRRENVRGKTKANQTHFEVGQKVRQTIADLGGTMPEALPTPKVSIRQLEKGRKKLGKKR